MLTSKSDLHIHVPYGNRDASVHCIVDSHDNPRKEIVIVTKKKKLLRLDKVKLAKIVGGLILPGELAKH